MKKILIATDGSPSATEAVKVGIELATEQKALAVLVHVVPAFDVLPVGGFAPTAPDPLDRGRSDARYAADSRRSVLGTDGLCDYRRSRQRDVADIAVPAGSLCRLVPHRGAADSRNHGRSDRGRQVSRISTGWQADRFFPKVRLQPFVELTKLSDDRGRAQQ